MCREVSAVRLYAQADCIHHMVHMKASVDQAHVLVSLPDKELREIIPTCCLSHKLHRSVAKLVGLNKL